MLSVPTRGRTELWSDLSADKFDDNSPLQCLHDITAVHCWLSDVTSSVTRAACSFSTPSPVWCKSRTKSFKEFEKKLRSIVIFEPKRCCEVHTVCVWTISRVFLLSLFNLIPVWKWGVPAKVLAVNKSPVMVFVVLFVSLSAIYRVGLSGSIVVLICFQSSSSAPFSKEQNWHVLSSSATTPVF